MSEQKVTDYKIQVNELLEALSNKDAFEYKGAESHIKSLKAVWKRYTCSQNETNEVTLQTVIANISLDISSQFRAFMTDYMQNLYAEINDAKAELQAVINAGRHPDSAEYKAAKSKVKQLKSKMRSICNLVKSLADENDA